MLAFRNQEKVNVQFHEIEPNEEKIKPKLLKLP